MYAMVINHKFCQLYRQKIFLFSPVARFVTETSTTKDKLIREKHANVFNVSFNDGNFQD